MAEYKHGLATVRDCYYKLRYNTIDYFADKIDKGTLCRSAPREVMKRLHRFFSLVSVELALERSVIYFK